MAQFNYETIKRRLKELSFLNGGTTVTLTTSGLKMKQGRAKRWNTALTVEFPIMFSILTRKRRPVLLVSVIIGGKLAAINLVIVIDLHLCPL